VRLGDRAPREVAARPCARRRSSTCRSRSSRWSIATASSASRRAGSTARRRLARIGAAGRHLLTLVNDVLDLAELEAGRSRVAAEAVPVRPLLEEIVSAALHRLARGVSELEPGALTRSEADDVAASDAPAPGRTQAIDQRDQRETRGPWRRY